MNPRDLIDQTTGQILPAQVAQAADNRAKFLVEKFGHGYAGAYETALGYFEEVAKSAAYVWGVENSNEARPMLVPDLDGVSHERNV